MAFIRNHDKKLAPESFLLSMGGTHFEEWTADINNRWCYPIDSLAYIDHKRYSNGIAMGWHVHGPIIDYKSLKADAPRVKSIPTMFLKGIGIAQEMHDYLMILENCVFNSDVYFKCRDYILEIYVENSFKANYEDKMTGKVFAGKLNYARNMMLIFDHVEYILHGILPSTTISPIQDLKLNVGEMISIIRYLDMIKLGQTCTEINCNLQMYDMCVNESVRKFDTQILTLSMFEEQA